jgi:hypothetical protein
MEGANLGFSPACSSVVRGSGGVFAWFEIVLSAHTGFWGASFRILIVGCGFGSEPARATIFFFFGAVLREPIFG